MLAVVLSFGHLLFLVCQSHFSVFFKDEIWELVVDHETILAFNEIVLLIEVIITLLGIVEGPNSKGDFELAVLLLRPDVLSLVFLDESLKLLVTLLGHEVIVREVENLESIWRLFSVHDIDMKIAIFHVMQLIGRSLILKVLPWMSRMVIIASTTSSLAATASALLASSTSSSFLAVIPSSSPST